MNIKNYKKNTTKLTKLQFEVTQNNATEQAFNNLYWNHKEPGIYIDVTNGQPLFLSQDKYDSFSGWPSFTKPIAPELLIKLEDNSHNLTRIEVRAKLSNAHLGHVFNDGPLEYGGLRYCINSASLDFIHAAELEDKGYKEYKKYFIIHSEKAYLAGGCFWGMEYYFAQLNNVSATKVGYMGGKINNPTYEMVKEGNSNHAEAIEVTFANKQLSYAEILKYFLKIHNPTTLNRQGNDVGTQYRSAIFYANKQQQEIALAIIEQANKAQIFPDKIVTEVVKAGKFYPAEEYHQAYLAKNPAGYNCHYLRPEWEF